MKMNLLQNRYLVIVTEPWEIELGLKIFSESNLDKNEVSFLVADHYSFLYQQKFLDSIFRKYNFSYFTIEEIYKKWQTSHKVECKKNRELINLWESKYCKIRTMKELLSTFQAIHGWEYNKFQYPIHESEKDEIYADLLKYLTNIFEKNSITKVVSISRRSFLSNVAYEYTLSQEIPMITLIHTRIGNRWMFRKDFGLGMSKEYLKQVKDTQIGEEALSYQSEIIAKKPLYQSLTHEHIDKIRMLNLQPVRYFVRTLPLILKRIASRTIHDRSSRKFQIKLLGESQIRLAKTELLTFLNSYLLTFIFRGIFYDREIRVDSFSWFLHARPEDSTLVLGLGKDELEEIERVSNAIGPDTTLYVKENALMYGLRDWSFYRKLKSLENVRIIRPERDNSELVKNPLGVLGLSGTILLEAKLQGKPAFALGLPEFIGILDNSHCRTLKDFIDFSHEKQGVADSRMALQYVQWILNNSSKDNVGFLENLTSISADKMVKTLAATLI